MRYKSIKNMIKESDFVFATEVNSQTKAKCPEAANGLFGQKTGVLATQETPNQQSSGSPKEMS